MGEIVKVNARELRSFNENRFAPNPVYQSDGMKVILAYFKKVSLFRYIHPELNWFYLLSRAKQKL